jgi:hypothetical protein
MFRSNNCFFNLGDDIMKILVISGLIMVSIFTLFIFLIIINFENNQAEQDCIYLKGLYNLTLDKSSLFHKCLIIENGIGYSTKEYYDLHKYDGIGVRN